MTMVDGSGIWPIGSKCLWLAVLVFGLTLNQGNRLAAQEDAPDNTAITAEVAEEAVGTLEDTSPAPAPDDTSSPLPGLVVLAIIVGLFVGPLLIGSFLAKKLRMPEHGWKFALALGTVAAAAAILYWGELKYGPDLSGGITLIYELQDTATKTVDNDDTQTDSQGQSISSRRQLVSQLVAALGERVDPSGTKEVSIREYGPDQIEIIIPKANQSELDYIERRIYTAGALEFRITASPVFAENREIIELAKALPLGVNEVRMVGRTVAEWMPYGEDEFGPPDREDPRVVKRLAGKVPQALILTNDGLDVTGKYLQQASAGIDETGRPQVNFVFDDRGAFLFGQLTSKHVPNPSGEEYHLGIILDKKLLSAPSIRSKITSQGRITGVNSKEEVDFVVGILNAGSLPLSLNKEPISRESISPTLGAETVQMGKKSIMASLLISIVFMFFYYRFAGFVACLALAANLIFTLGIMVLLHAAFTLPGLAGLILSIGMSVDANVLIYERMREERGRGASLRMAIRNGYDRAMTTIIDSNVTNLITAVVIYKIAPDNVKGFGITLIIGIVMSMYSAVFLTRIVFDIAERWNLLGELKMSQIIGVTNFDFMSKRRLAIGLSWVLIAIGFLGVFDRGKDLLNIDFTGGSSVTLVLNEKNKMTFSEVKDILEETDLKDKNLSLVEVGNSGTRFTVSSIEEDVIAVQKTLQEKFGDRLQTYQVKAEKIESLGEQTGAIRGPATSSVNLVNFQEDAASEESKDDSDEEQDVAKTEEDVKPASSADASKPSESSKSESAVDLFAGGTSAQLRFGSEEAVFDAGVNHETVTQLLQDALEASGHGDVAFNLSNPDYQLGSARRFATWDVKLALPTSESTAVLEQLEKSTNDRPVFPLANKIGGRIAGDLRTKAIASIVISLLGIIAYIWFRFHSVVYGIAAVVALLHDVLITIGILAMSAWLVSYFPGLAQALMIEKFQISLTIVAAILTIIGYSLNDTIVVFDRIREVKGKSRHHTSEMINTSINQTLSRTLLTSLTTIFSVIVLYFRGGDGIHGFSFTLLVGIIVGTYSSIFIASPILLWMSKNEDGGAVKARA